MKNTIKIFILLTTITSINMACSSDDDSVQTDDGDVIVTDCSNTTSVFTINLDPSECDIDIQTQLGIDSQYEESVSGNTRTITINGIANHKVGEFPNSGNPNTISEAGETFTMTTNAEIASNVTYGMGYTFGVLFSGVAVDPYTGEFFVGTNGVNMEWNITTLQSTTSLGLDCNNAHVQPTGRYHYHGTPNKFIDDLGIANGNQMIKVGYAGDGFPIYYKYGYADDNITIMEYSSGFQLKTEDRGGDGLTAPDGCPDGYYFRDYEYVSGVSDLDECNGRFGKTPEADDEYYYTITDNFPSSPLCFSGTPDNSFNFF